MHGALYGCMLLRAAGLLCNVLSRCAGQMRAGWPAILLGAEPSTFTFESPTARLLLTVAGRLQADG